LAGIGAGLGEGIRDEDRRTVAAGREMIPDLAALNA